MAAAQKHIEFAETKVFHTEILYARAMGLQQSSTINVALSTQLHRVKAIQTLEDILWGKLMQAVHKEFKSSQAVFSSSSIKEFTRVYNQFSAVVRSESSQAGVQRQKSRKQSSTGLQSVFSSSSTKEFREFTGCSSTAENNKDHASSPIFDNNGRAMCTPHAIAARAVCSDCDVTTCGKKRHGCDGSSPMAAPTRVLNHHNWWFETPKVDAAELQPLCACRVKTNVEEVTLKNVTNAPSFNPFARQNNSLVPSKFCC
ncbi:hypothetical protein GQR58_023250 [Nymphon striatum]|nr:hypothetical protein GQR58_023250 [Nymphon striatum]